jgi:hypothetical protein
VVVASSADQGCRLTKPSAPSRPRRIVYASGEVEDLDIDEIARDGHMALL